jgi:hypothetical protein
MPKWSRKIELKLLQKKLDNIRRGEIKTKNKGVKIK